MASDGISFIPANLICYICKMTTLTFNEYELQFEYTTEQKRSIALLSHLCQRQGTSIDTKRTSNSSILSTSYQQKAKSDTLDASQSLTKSGLLGAPIDSNQQFMSWYSDIQAEMESKLQLKYQKLLGSINDDMTVTLGTKQQLIQLQSILDSLDSNYQFIVEKTSSLQQSSEDMLKQQQMQISIGNELQEKLQHYNHLEGIASMLTMSSQNELVYSADFSKTLVILDTSIDFITRHEKYKDSQLYLMHYRQCMTRCMTIIKIQFINEINLLSHDVSNSLKVWFYRSS